jgi:7-carboxy-7-deazaguanine synthase
MSSLRVTEIFHSIQGESRTVGLPTAFIRLTGCPLRCHYCDTEYAFYGGKKMSTDAIISVVKERKVQNVTVTGGEPLAQPQCRTLLALLCDYGYSVSIETSGAMDIGAIDARVSVVMDLKTPGSGEVSRNLLDNISKLKDEDQLKFVICNRGDYEWARFKIQELRLTTKVKEILFSASHGELESQTLADWILSDELPVRLQVQLHKILWGDARGV